MPYSANPQYVDTDRIRLAVGDTDVDEEALTDGVYKWLISSTGSESLAVVEALKILVAEYGKHVDEVATGLESKDSQRFKQYLILLDRYTKDPSMMKLGAAQPYAGGISKSDIEANHENGDSVHLNYDLEAWSNNAIFSNL